MYINLVISRYIVRYIFVDNLLVYIYGMHIRFLQYTTRKILQFQGKTNSN